MTNYQRLYDGIGRAAWGYFFIYFDFNISAGCVRNCNVVDTNMRIRIINTDTNN